jgi:predicted metal-dependent phosphoesterase TrpH
VLVYEPDPEHPGLVAELARLRGERARRSSAILDRLAELGAPVEPSAVAARAGGAPIGRPHIADALVAAGHAADREDAFRRYLGDGGPAWVPKHALAPADGVRLARAAGGVAVLAHPASSRHPLDTEVLPAMLAAGLAGVEADHPGHAPADAERWRALAAEHDLVVTGGSDFHGTGQKEIGAATTSSDAVAALRRRAGLAQTSQTSQTCQTWRGSAW